MPKLLPISEKREWYSPKDVEAVYGISRTTLFRIMKDAEEKGMPIKFPQWSEEKQETSFYPNPEEEPG